MTEKSRKRSPFTDQPANNSSNSDKVVVCFPRESRSAVHNPPTQLIEMETIPSNIHRNNTSTKMDKPLPNVNVTQVKLTNPNINSPKTKQPNLAYPPQFPESYSAQQPLSRAYSYRNNVFSRNSAYAAERTQLSRKRTLTRPARPEDHPIISRSRKNILAPESEIEKTWFHPWRFFSALVTCCFPSFCLDSCCGMREKQVRQAWREKVALCFISLLLCALLGFLTFAAQSALCGTPPGQFEFSTFAAAAPPNHVAIMGTVYNINSFLNAHASLPSFQDKPLASAQINRARGIDVSAYFPIPLSTTCASLLQNSLVISCSTPNFPGLVHCHNYATTSRLLAPMAVGKLTYDWSYLTTNQIVYNNAVLDMTQYFRSNITVFSSAIEQAIRSHGGKDVTKALSIIPDGPTVGKCLSQVFAVGAIDSDTIGCFTSQVLLIVSLLIIGSLILVRFLFAVWFSWFISKALGRLEKNVIKRTPKRRNDIAKGEFSIAMSDDAGNLHLANSRSAVVGIPTSHKTLTRKFGTIKSKSTYGSELYTIMLVTCYSEDREGIESTFRSLAMTDYNEDFKLLFIISDGIIKGSGNSQTTPDIILSLLERDENWPEPMPFAYQAVAQGSKMLNYAKVYVAWYNYKGRSVPTICVIKCGGPSEAQGAKPGNRGKRDSQIMLMRFLERVTLNERLCPFEFDLFQKMHYLMGVTPDNFEIVLMVDADTKVAPDSLARMVACMARDPLVMGLCGETRISNKTDSYITRIQVFEYYLSHHMVKAFESVFGGVTCLPGCFSMYRIKTQKDGGWVPILANSDIVNVYASSVVDTLHKKNLLLLGEDRFLTTMMLRTFPKRKLIFVPRAYCKTTVPNTFKVLLSQRRRWINSTVHNLMELLLVDELCGIFCFSMQFVILIELIGTVTLPAAIIFTIVLIVSSIIGPPQWLPLALLVAIIGLPAILILFTTRRLVYIYWMLIYLTGLPIWNFVLPTYAFWHFDDFSWGETRKIEGESAKDGHVLHDGSKMTVEIPLRKWEEWEKDRRRHIIKSIRTSKRKQ